MTYDERPLISDLLSEHSLAIEAVREGILADNIGQDLHNKANNSKLYDEIWILRFILSHKSNVKAATKAALETMKFREERKLNELGDLRHRIKNFGDASEDNSSIEWLSPEHEIYNTHCDKHATLNFMPDTDRGIIEIVNVDMVDMREIAKDMSKESLGEIYLHDNESRFQVLDCVTRRTGRLTKYIKLFDMSGMKLSKISHDYIRKDAAASKVTEDFYPQFLGMICVLNCPGWISVLWKMTRPLFPKRVAEKMDFFPPVPKMGKLKEGSLKPILRYISEENLPKRFGGKNNEWPLPPTGKIFANKD
mmetsp:Transcript_37117/g.68156  ORF Transcript_37117/g.68156 Transcript_37117/m.68156 type:complete len:307 (-) Transcript_37117:54-974(-)